MLDTFVIQRLRKQIGSLCCRRHMFQIDEVVLDQLTKVVVSVVDMLTPLVESRVVSTLSYLSLGAN